MRVLVPRRAIGMVVLFALLCLPAASSHVYAKPVPYDDKGNPNLPPPPGDGDGVVVKAGTIGSTPSLATTTTQTSGRPYGWSWALQYLRLVRMGYGFRWYW
jgi:hypothetical protein